jgi:GNAT superfamily N-acetyltransferase
VSTAVRFTVRAMSDRDVEACSRIFDAALDRLRHDLGLPTDPDDQGTARARITHLMKTDPAESVVAVEGRTVLGFGQATHRGDVWVLAHLFVDPAHQSARVGTELLRQLHPGSTSASVALIGATADPRAIRAYAALPHFQLHPTVRAEGRVTQRPVRSPMVETLRSDMALEQAGAIDLEVRGGARTSDLSHLIDNGYRIRSVSERGYALANSTSIATIAAFDDEAATALLEDALADTAPGSELELPRMTANQQWAITVTSGAGLRLRPWGPLMVRGRDHPPTPYLPHPALC